jgi:hypothetical protein
VTAERWPTICTPARRGYWPGAPKPPPPGWIPGGWRPGLATVCSTWPTGARTRKACLQALRDSRLPARLYPGYWDNLARCCGTAGVGQLLLDRYQATGDRALLDWCGTLASDVLARAVTSSNGVTWSNTEHTRDPAELPPEPGLMQGTAGIAGWLARLHALRTGSGPPSGSPRVGRAWL